MMPTAFIDYRRSGQRLLLVHTEVPLCPFVASYLKRHPEYLGLVSDKVRRDMNLG